LKFQRNSGWCLKPVLRIANAQMTALGEMVTLKKTKSLESKKTCN
jgi:hypothetical protein